MRQINLLFLALLMSATVLATPDNDKFKKAMQRNLMMLDTATTQQTVMNVANQFERIATAEESQWLAWYWAGYSNVVASYIEKDGKKKDQLLDKADRFAAKADSLNPGNDEIHVLKGWIHSARINVNPMTRGMKYGPLSGKELEKAKSINEDNPRYYYLTGMSLFYTPEMFGGDKEKACEMFDTALEKFDVYIPESEIHPDWGKEEVLNMKEQCE